MRRLGRAGRAGWTEGREGLVQTNFGGNLTIAGAPIYRLLQPPSRTAADRSGAEQHIRAGDGSCMIVVATDAVIDARDLERLGGDHFPALSSAYT